MSVVESPDFGVPYSFTALPRGKTSALVISARAKGRARASYPRPCHARGPTSRYTVSRGLRAAAVIQRPGNSSESSATIGENAGVLSFSNGRLTPRCSGRTRVSRPVQGTGRATRRAAERARWADSTSGSNR